MKNIFNNLIKVSMVLLAFVYLTSCNEDEETSYIFDQTQISAPSDLVANLVISEETAKTISLTPVANNTSAFEIYFGEIEDEAATMVALGETITHTYAEDGNYFLKIIARGITGLTSEYSSDITVGDPMVITPVEPVDPVDPNNALNLPVDYESSDLVFDVSGFGSATAAVIDNPDTEGNSSTKVLEIVKANGANTWAGAGMPLDGAINFSSSSVVSIMVWSPRVGTPILFKVEDSTSERDGNNNPSVFAEVEAISTVANAWEELTFDMSTETAFDVNISYDTIIIFPDFDFEGVGETFYFDNVMLSGDSGSGGGNSLEPDTAAPTPTQAAADVVSIYSDSYTNITTNEWNPDWGQTTTLETADLNGNEILKYSMLNYTGIVTDYDNATDLTGYTYVHYDYWTVDAESLGLKLVNTVGGYADGSPDKEELESVASVTTGEWVGVDILLSDYTTDLSGLTQLLFESSGGTVFIDNLYFYSGTPDSSSASEPTTAAPAPAEAAGDVISIYSDSYTNITTNEWNPNWGQTTTLEIVDLNGNEVLKYSLLNYTGIVTDYDNATDLTAFTHVHFDYWTVDAETLGLKLVNTVGGYADGSPDKEELESVASVATGEWVGVDILLSDYTTDLSGLTQLLFESSGGTVFIDNLYFY